MFGGQFKSGGWGYLGVSLSRPDEDIWEVGRVRTFRCRFKLGG
jgi:hypothetical protein